MIESNAVHSEVATNMPAETEATTSSGSPYQMEVERETATTSMASTSQIGAVSDVA